MIAASSHPDLLDRQRRDRCTPILIAMALCLLTQDAFAQEWQTIDCGTSPFKIDGEAQCRQVQREVGTASIERLTGLNYNVSGRRGSMSFLAAYYPPAAAPVQPATPPVAAPAPASAPSAASGSVEQRLRQLQSLKDQGLITPTEYDSRRKAIIDGL